MKYTLKYILFFGILYGVCFFGIQNVLAAPTVEKEIGSVRQYVYDSKCPGAKKQSLIFNITTSNFDNAYLVIHGQTSPSLSDYCTGSFNLCTRAQEKNKSVFIAFSMSGSGSEWVNNFDFTCLYNEASTQLTSLSKKMPGSHIIAGFSYGGAAIKKIYDKNVEPKNVQATLMFDACFPGWCESIAKVPSGRRGVMHIYASNAQGNNNGPKNQEGAKKALAVSQDAIKYVYVPTNSHGSIPNICFRDHYTNDECENKGQLQNDPDLTDAEKANLSKGLGNAYNAQGMTLDEVAELIKKPVPVIKIPGLSFLDPTKENLVTTESDGKIYINIPYLGQYIAATYRYGMIFMSIVAVVILIRAGFMWMMSGGGDKGHAMEKITGAILGLCLAAGSYTILYFINPELVRISSLRVLFIQEAPLTAISEETADTELAADTEIAGPVADVSEIDATYFMSTQINSQAVDGWSIWQGFTPEQKAIVFPYLYKQLAPKCPEGHLVEITDIAGWKGKKIHPALLDSFRQVNLTAKNIGFQLLPGTAHRPAEVMVPLWNTGVVARYKQDRKDWEKNESKIARPTCQTGHSMGAAIDANLVHTKSGKKLSASDPTKITAENYSSKFASDPYKVILEQIFYKNGWVRYCTEHWHFEYAVTTRYKAWDKKARCWEYTNTFETPIPDAVKDEANKIIGSLFVE